MRFRLFVAAALLSASVAAHADTLASVTTGSVLNVATGFIGQSFTVAGSGTYQNIAFNFYTGSLVPFATGTGYLLSQAYTGTPAGLSSAVAGYLGSTLAAGGAWNFGSSLSLTAGSQYYFYENSLLSALTVSGGGTYAGGGFYSSTGSSSPYVLDSSTSSNSSNFAVTGTKATSVTPEPSSFLLLGTGLVGVVGSLKRRFV